MASPPPLPKTQSVSYRSRTSALDKEQVLTLENHQLLIITDSHVTETLPLAQLASVNLRYFPSRVQTKRYECHLRWNSGRRLKVCNQFFVGMANFRDQSQSYLQWIQQLHHLTVQANPHCKYTTGVGPLRYALNALFILGVFTLLGFVMFVMWTSIPAIAIVKLILIIFYLPILVLWFKRNKPNTYSPAAPPTQVLP